MIRFVCLVAAMLVLLVTSADQANAQAPLFSQYTTQGNGSPSAAAYPAPHWSPILGGESYYTCLLYTSPSPRDRTRSRMPSSA